MPLIDTLTDDFEATSVDTVKWPGNYGGISQTGGRGRVDCAVAYWSGWKSAAAYTLTGSVCGGRFWPPASAGATTTAYMSIFVTTTTAGTDAGFNIDVQSGFMGILLRVGFSDSAPVFVAYSPTDHAWLRVREDGGSLLWEASPDGDAWTTLRSATTPAWASDPDLALLIECKRIDGSDNYGEIDNINLYATAPEEHSGTAAYGLAVDPAGSGRKTTSGDAATGLVATVGAGGRKHTSGVAVVGLTPAVGGSGAKQTSGAADVGVTVAPVVSGRKQTDGGFATGLILGPAATGRKRAVGTTTASLAIAPNVVGRRKGRATVAAGLVVDPATVGRKRGIAADTIGFGVALAATGRTRRTGVFAATTTLAVGVTSTRQVIPGTHTPGSSRPALTVGGDRPALTPGSTGPALTAGIRG
ncbi:hypothetical protein [Plantactinospora sp. WMMB782]|uniref:hypothetical protein n=1 Tax=Plantactinospora sp. WMMB782 TaxID=3404121 RepID=UPI003B95C6CC